MSSSSKVEDKIRRLQYLQNEIRHLTKELQIGSSEYEHDKSVVGFRLEGDCLDVNANPVFKPDTCSIGVETERVKIIEKLKQKRYRRCTQTDPVPELVPLRHGKKKKLVHPIQGKGKIDAYRDREEDMTLHGRFFKRTYKFQESLQKLSPSTSSTSHSNCLAPTKPKKPKPFAKSLIKDSTSFLNGLGVLRGSNSKDSLFRSFFNAQKKETVGPFSFTNGVQQKDKPPLSRKPLAESEINSHTSHLNLKQKPKSKSPKPPSTPPGQVPIKNKKSRNKGLVIGTEILEPKDHFILHRIRM